MNFATFSCLTRYAVWTFGRAPDHQKAHPSTHWNSKCGDGRVRLACLTFTSIMMGTFWVLTSLLEKHQKFLVSISGEETERKATAGSEESKEGHKVSEGDTVRRDPASIANLFKVTHVHMHHIFEQIPHVVEIQYKTGFWAKAAYTGLAALTLTGAAAAIFATGGMATAGALVIVANSTAAGGAVAAGIGATGLLAAAAVHTLMSHTKALEKAYKVALTRFVSALGGNVGQVRDDCGSMEDEIALRLNLPPTAYINGVYSREKGDAREAAVEKHLKTVKLKGVFRSATNKSLCAVREKLKTILLVRELLRHSLNKAIGLSVMGITKAGKSCIVSQLSSADTYADER